MSTNETPLSDVRFLTVAEVASIMRVSKMTVYRLVHSGELEAIRVGRSFRVPEQAVNQYLRGSFVAARQASLPGSISDRSPLLLRDGRSAVLPAQWVRGILAGGISLGVSGADEDGNLSRWRVNVGVCPPPVSGLRKHASRFLSVERGWCRGLRH